MRRLLCVLLLTGCTASTGPSVRPAPEGATTGGVLRIGITAPGSIDPGNDYEPMGDLIVRTMCDPLIAADPMTGELRPALAESWVVTDSGQRLVLRLRKGLRFSDGSRLTADDVAFSLSRVASADFASAAASRLELIDGYRFVHGDAETDNDSERRSLKGVRVLDEQSVEITLSNPHADFLRVLTSPLTTPVPRAAGDVPAFGRRPVCSGPYVLTAPFLAGDTVVRLNRSPDHVGTDTSLTLGGAGYADTVEFRVFPTVAAAAAAQRRGEVDVAAAEPADTDVQTGPGPLVEFVGFPTSKTPVFDKLVVRRALALALDREALVASVFPGTRTAATGFLPPTTLPAFVADACGDLPVRGDVTKAQSLLTEAGVDLRGVRAPLYVNRDGKNLRLAQAVAARWKATLGFTAVVTPSTFDDYVLRGTSTQGFDGPFRFSWSTSFPDPDGSLYPLFSSERVGRDNFSRFSDPTVDRALVRQAREAEDATDRQLDYRKVEQLLCTSLPMVPLTFSTSRYLVAKTVTSAAPTYVDRTNGQLLVRELHLP